MIENTGDSAMSTSDTVPANKIKVLRVGERPRDQQSLMVVDEETVGFDPYDTASLFVQKTANKSADQS
jgi:hypothetical protein